MENKENRTIDRQEAIYQNAMILIEGELYAEASAELARIPGYRDASERKIECDRLAVDKKKDDIYAEADRAAGNPNVRSLQKAIKIFSTIPGWRDADERIEEAKRRIDEVVLKERTDREEAIRAAKAEELKRKKRRRTIIRALLISALALVVCVAGVFLFRKYATPAIRYHRGVTLIEQGRPDEAYRILHELDYRDSNDRIRDIVKERLENAEVGSTVRFGSYPKGHITSKEKDDIEWLVLDRDGTKLLLITKQVIDCYPFQRYDRRHDNVAWNTSVLRSWLNGEFSDIAFDKGERLFLVRTRVRADQTPYSTSSDPDTIDRVFVLSVQEAQKYFPDEESRKCTATQYAVEFGAYQSSKGKSSIWWLRTPGGQTITEMLDEGAVPVSSRVACVGTNGAIITVGHDVHTRGYGVRPVIWVNTEATDTLLPPKLS